MFKNNIAKKFYSCLLIIMAGITFSMSLVIIEGRITNNRLETISAALFPAAQKNQAVLTCFEKQAKLYQDAIVFGDKSLLEEAKKKGDEAIKEAEEITHFSLLDKSNKDLAAKNLKMLKSYTEAAGPLYELMATGKQDQDRASELNKYAQSLKESLELGVKNSSGSLLGSISLIQHDASRDLYINCTAFLFAFFTAIMVLKVIVNLIRRIKDTVARLRSSTEGEWDLTVRFDESSKDELGEVAYYLNKFTEKLLSIVLHLSSSSKELNRSTGLLQNATQQIAASTEEVSNQTQTVAVSSMEMSATSSDISRSCHHAAEASAKAYQAASDGAIIINSSIECMAVIVERVSGASAAISQLGDRSDQISTIVGTIEDIADQTNLLALNAAIEAARAGEHGKGFAVVADEVRLLSQRTATATKEIERMIKSINSDISSAILMMQEGVSQVEKGTEETSKSGRALELIIGEVNLVTIQISQIATATGQLAATSVQINQNIGTINSEIDQNLSSANQTARTASELSGLSNDFQEVVSCFKF
jgi:methyl-accepting chemotaxis protein